MMGCLSGCLARPKDPQSSEPVPSPNFLRSLFGRSNSAGGRHQNPRRRLETRRRGDICRASGSRSPERFRIVMALEAFLRSAVFLMIDYRNESGVQKAWTATGIIRYRAGQAFLVTALHNLTGREPDGRCKDDYQIGGEGDGVGREASPEPRNDKHRSEHRADAHTSATSS